MERILERHKTLQELIGRRGNTHKKKDSMQKQQQ
jgi:hypothetical protein